MRAARRGSAGVLRAATRRLASALVAAVAAAIALTGATGAAGAAEPLALHACGDEARDRSRCGTVRVPLDRGGALPGSIDLRVRLLDPRSGEPGATVVALAGGPGQAATPLLEQIVSGLGAAGRSRRVVTFDQRGTGLSGRLACPAISDARLTLAETVARCAQQLGPRRTAYTTAATVADVEAVREALGAERIVLYGTSYGTKVALDYAAAHPERVERLLLDSVVPPTGADPFLRSTLVAVKRVLGGLCAGRGCPFTRAPTADVAALVRRLARAPLRGSALDGGGRPRPVTIARVDLLGLLLQGDLDAYLRAALPAAVTAALRGDAAPLLRLAFGQRGGEEGSRRDSDALYLATTCEDGAVPWPAGTPPEQRRAAVNAAAAAIPDAAFAPFDRATIRSLGTADLCRGWPESPISQPSGALPDVPALLLSGDDDLRTPRDDAEAVAGQLPRAVVLHVPNTGHGVLASDPTDCAQRAAIAFLDGGTPASCRQRRRLLRPSAPPPRRLADLRPPRGTLGHAGRTVAAVLLTYGDAVDQVVARTLQSGGAVASFGGLRAGSATLDPRRGLRLRGYSYVPGVTIGGTVRPEEPQLTLTVGGAAAARGSVTLSADGLRGRLGGRTVRLPAAALRAASAAVAGAAGELPPPRLGAAPPTVAGAAAAGPRSPRPGALGGRR
ncbi:alpha/beta fold hydrolase [Conexibacter arvalis]|uniref:Pimeloyl-ACP methyl ester carboxylesterase n=1 Tax=Conexibacter arvalis TaxID=912552 RepID=A0A840IEN5_9ACTN|nr:pimeloyl-ACP methyl ester carboxylesterase [Conexibacter arvalis]